MKKLAGNKYWRAGAAVVLAYEAVALVTNGRLPFISTVVRRLPRPMRHAAAVAVAAALHDHFDTQRFF